MAVRLQIMCINKTPRFEPHLRIRNVGGISGGRAWKISMEEAIAGIGRGEWSFYVSNAGLTVEVIVATSAAGHPYLKTTADGLLLDNLLSLRECP